MLKRFLFFIFLFFYTSLIFAQQVIIKGYAKTYAGEELLTSCFTEQITFTEQIISKTKVKRNGYFEFKFNIDKTQLVFIHLNVFKALVYVEPNNEYEIVLPKKTEKLAADKFNPFFKEIEFYPQILNKDSLDLNYQIKKFDFLYDKYLDKYFRLFNGKLNKSKTDTIIHLINSETINPKNNFFEKYKKYNYISLQLMAYERNKENLIEKSFAKDDVLFKNPAYMNLFNQIFNNYLSVLYRNPKGKMIPYNLIREKSLKKLKHSLDSFPYLNNEKLKEIVIIKSLYDNFYKDDFPQEDIMLMIDSVKISANNKIIKIIANNVLLKIKTLLLGYDAPEFYLPDINKKFYTNTNFRNKFIYLNFCSPDSYTCMQEFELLKKLHKQNFELFEIVTICITDDIKTMKDFIKENNFKWKFLFYNNDNKLLKNYNVKVYPSYYLINPEGKLSMSPAFPPSEPSFEDRYLDILKAWKIEMQKRKYKKGKGTGR